MTRHAQWAGAPDLQRLGRKFDDEWRDFLDRMDRRGLVDADGKVRLIQLFHEAFETALLEEDNPARRATAVRLTVRSNAPTPASAPIVPHSTRNLHLALRHANEEGHTSIGASVWAGLPDSDESADDDDPGAGTPHPGSSPPGTAWKLAVRTAPTAHGAKQPDAQATGPSASGARVLGGMPSLGAVAVLLCICAVGVVLFTQSAAHWAPGASSPVWRPSAPAHAALRTPPPARFRVTKTYEAGGDLVLAEGDMVEVLEAPVTGWLKVRAAGGGVGVSCAHSQAPLTAAGDPGASRVSLNYLAIACTAPR